MPNACKHGGQLLLVLQDEATHVERRLRDLNKARLQLERESEAADQRMDEVEAQLSERISAMPQGMQSKYNELQGEVWHPAACVWS